MDAAATAGGGGGGGERAGAVAEPVLAGGAREPGPGAEEESAAASRGCGRAERGTLPLRLQLGRGRRRAGAGTPAPSWKMEDEEAGEAAGAAAARRSSASASARQLGATLWEIHGVAREGRRRRRGAKGDAGGREHGGGGEELDRPQSSGGFGGHLADSVKHHKLHEERSHKIQPFSPASYTSSVGDSGVNRTISPTRSSDIRGRFRGTGSSLKTSTELLKVLNRIWSLEEQHTANLSVVNGLKSELQQAQAHIQELRQERRQYRHEISSLMRQLSENKVVKRNKDHGNIEEAVHSLQGDLVDERHLRRHSEDLHRKLGKELCGIKSAFFKAVKDLEKERQANRLLEDLCDQFAMGIRNYEDEVRVVKQSHVKSYELNFDKSVLHIAEAWLDERVQMQNIDVNGNLAQKATITERLSSEIQAFLLSKRSGSSKNNEKHMNGIANLRRQSRESVHLNGATSAPQLAEDDDGDSVASDLHCFELNMHGKGIQNHGHTGPCRSGTASMDMPRRSEHCNGIAAEDSHISRVAQDIDFARSSSSKLQHASKVQEISSHGSTRITPAEEQNGTTSAHISRGFHNGSLKNNLEPHHVDCLGQESLDHYSRTSLFCEGTTSGDLGNLGSPMRQPNYQSTSLDPEISECSPEQPVGVMGSTLKAKLLQARLEGRHARLKASGGSLTSRRK